tara:strand:- start:126 stop:776 length:651 start_codon:yes stop_codon:yes gene_type:complete
MQKTALIVAGGKGKRMNSNIPKQFLKLKELPVLMHTLKKFDDFDNLLLVLPKLKIEIWKKLCNEYNFNQKHTIVEGGKTRSESVKNGLARIKNNVIVAIHDGVRPLVSKDLIKKVIQKVHLNTGSIPIIPIKDSLRKVDNKKSIRLDRSNIYRVQTPQCFISNEIKNAYDKIKCSQKFTDDASVFENNQGEINTVIGEENNIKITTKKDLLIADLF